MSSFPDPAAVETREQFVAFVRQMEADLRSGDADWENLDLPSFLEALAAWVDILRKHEDAAAFARELELLRQSACRRECLRMIDGADRVSGTRWLPIRYREFHDIPRIFVVDVADGPLLFDCPFDDEIDEYPAVYRVYRLPREIEIPSTGSWEHLSAAGSFVAEVPTGAVTFDPTRRALIDGSILDRLRS